jgi:hypothetical protein
MFVPLQSWTKIIEWAERKPGPVVVSRIAAIEINEVVGAPKKTEPGNS